MKNSKKQPLNAKEEVEEIEYLKQLDRCHLEHAHIPTLITAIKADLVSTGVLFDIEHWKKVVNKDENREFYYEWDKLSILQLPGYMECRIIIYKFPKPVMMPDVKYAAIIIDNISDVIYYYTLELSIDNTWILHGRDQINEYNYGEAKSGELKDFVIWLKNNIKRNREQYNI